MKDFLKSFVYAINGIAMCLRTERNLRIQVLIAVFVISAGFYFAISFIEWCVILLCIGLVLAAELVNTSIEKLVDLTTKERSPVAGKIKDMAAGSVLIISVTAFFIAIIIFGKYIQ